MPIRNTLDQWGWISIGLHWLSLIVVLSLAAVGLAMTELPTGAFKIQVYALHKSFGLTVLLLTILRLLWRAVSPAPTPLAGTSRLQDIAAKAVHGMLYLLLILMPFSGWLFNSAAGFPLRWFDLFSLPRLSHYDPNIKAFARESHETLFYILATLVLLHACAALWHHYRQHDRVLARMLPWRERDKRAMSKMNS